MKTFKCIAKCSSSPPEHIHNTMFISGEIYLCFRDGMDRVQVSGKFVNRLGGFETKSQSLRKCDCREYLIIIEKSEKCIYPARVVKFLPNGELDPAGKPYDCYENHKNDPVGTILHHDAGAPGIGFTREMITRTDSTGVYGVLIEDTMRTLTPEECI